MRTAAKWGVCCILSVLILCSARLTPEAKSRPLRPPMDEPVTTTIVVGVTIGLITAGVVWAVGQLFGGDERICTTTTTTSTWPSGRTETKTETKYSQSPQTLSIPADFPGFTLPPGYRQSETVRFDATPAQQVAISYENLDHYANVLDPAFNGPRVAYETTRISMFRFDKPPSAPPGVDGIAQIPLSSDGFVLSTTDIPGTQGFSQYEWTIESRELGTVFRSSVTAIQGQPTVIAGDIPAVAFDTSVNGRVELTNFSQTLIVPIPAALGAVHFTAVFRTTGEGRLTPVPAAYSSFGTGCLGSNGIPTLAAGRLTGGVRDLPWVGEPFEIEVTALPPSGPAAILTSFADSNPPLSLALIGMPGCSLHTAGDTLSRPLVNVGGSASWTLAIPPNPAIVGFPFFNQALVVDPTANTLGVTVSNPGVGLIGRR